MKQVSRVIEEFVCDVCGEAFPDAEWCGSHEATCAKDTEDSRQRVEKAFNMAKERFSNDAVLLFLVSGGHEDDANAILQERIWKGSPEMNRDLNFDEDTLLHDMMMEHLKSVAAVQ